MPRKTAIRRLTWLAAIWTATGLSGAMAGSNQFCGGPATPGDPSDLANVVGDQTLEYAVQQPASLITCARGYLLVKCGDFATANQVFDKCIAAGYVGAMIWKALMIEDGTGAERDLAEAARLMHRAATSDDPAYAKLGKLHYATMLLQGRGVPQDEAEARRWFEAAAQDGSPDAEEYLRTGYHTGARDQSTLGAGAPPPGALVAGLTGDNASLVTENRKNGPKLKSRALASLSPSPRFNAVAARPPHQAAPSPVAPSSQRAPDLPDTVPPVTGQRLSPVASPTEPSVVDLGRGGSLALLAAFCVGLLLRRRWGNAFSPLADILSPSLTHPAALRP